MKNIFRLRVAVWVAGLMLGARSGSAEVMVGDPAPPNQTGEFVQGQPVHAFDRNHVYVVEFWATWCGPCVGSIPHLNALSQKYQDQGVVFIGQDVWDNDGDVAKFVKKMGTNMTYRVALDDKSQIANGFMSDHWWKRGTNYHGIPTSFIINRDGIVAWIGHPMELKEQVLDDVLAGHYDLAKAAADYRESVANNAKFQELNNALRDAVKQKKWDEAQAAADSLRSAFPKFKGLVIPQLQIFLGQKKYDEAIQLAESQRQAYGTNVNWLNELAWTVATSDGPDGRCLELGRAMAESARQLTQGTNTAVLDTLARVQFMLGKKDDAIAMEQEAADLEQNQREKDSLQKSLASYKEGKLPDVNE